MDVIRRISDKAGSRRVQTAAGDCGITYANPHGYAVSSPQSLLFLAGVLTATVFLLRSVVALKLQSHNERKCLNMAHLEHYTKTEKDCFVIKEVVRDLREYKITLDPERTHLNYTIVDSFYGVTLFGGVQLNIADFRERLIKFKSKS